MVVADHVKPARLRGKTGVVQRIYTEDWGYTEIGVYWGGVIDTNPMADTWFLPTELKRAS